MEVYVDMRTLAELIGVTYETARRWRYDEDKYYWREPNDFPKPWGYVAPPGRAGGQPAPIFPLSEVFDWLARRRPYDLRIATQFGSVGRELANLGTRLEGG